jgi:hypothetical protein
MRAELSEIVANSFPSQPISKICWAATIMREGYNFQSIGQANKHYLVRKGMNRHLANIRVVYAGYAPADLGKGLDHF